MADDLNLSCVAVQHHHAHIAACLADNDWPIDGPAVLGIALDGMGYGEGGCLWGGEFILADYCHYKRLATFKPVAMLGGAQAMRQPWRNTYAQIAAATGFEQFQRDYGNLELTKFLLTKPLPTQDQHRRAINIIVWPAF